IEAMPAADHLLWLTLLIGRDIRLGVLHRLTPDLACIGRHTGMGRNDAGVVGITLVGEGPLSGLAGGGGATRPSTVGGDPIDDGAVAPLSRHRGDGRTGVIVGVYRAQEGRDTPVIVMGTRTLQGGLAGAGSTRHLGMDTGIA